VKFVTCSQVAQLAFVLKRRHETTGTRLVLTSRTLAAAAFENHFHFLVDKCGTPEYLKQRIEMHRRVANAESCSPEDYFDDSDFIALSFMSMPDPEEVEPQVEAPQKCECEMRTPSLPIDLQKAEPQVEAPQKCECEMRTPSLPIDLQKALRCTSAEAAFAAHSLEVRKRLS
jgi:hypothetical protein